MPQGLECLVEFKQVITVGISEEPAMNIKQLKQQTVLANIYFYQ